MAASCQRKNDYFEDDLVWKLESTHFKCGLVLENLDANNDDDDYGRVVKNGEIQVAWYPKGEEESVSIDKVKLCDRTLLVGDTVRRLTPGIDSQRGIVTNVKVQCAVRVLGRNTSFVLHGVDYQQIEPLTKEFDPSGRGTKMVNLDNWVGQIDNVTFNITFQFPDGARCLLVSSDMEEKLSSFEDVYEKRDIDSEFYPRQFYCGQVLKGVFGVLRGAVWLKSTKQHSAKTLRRDKLKTITVTVISVEVESIDVFWLTSGCSDYNLGAQQRHINGENLKRIKVLNLNEQRSVQMGTKGYYTVNKNDCIMALNKTKLKHVLHETVSENLNQFRNAPALLNESCQGREANIKLKEVKSSTVSNFLKSNKSKAAKVKKGTKKAKNLLFDEDVDLITFSSSSDDEDVSQSRDSKVLLHHRPKMQRLLSKKRCWSDHTVGVGKKSQKRVKKEEMSADKLKHSSDEITVGDKIPVEVMYTSTVVDVMWQSGCVEHNIPAVDLFPMYYLDELEFFPGDFIESSIGYSSDKYGIVEMADHIGRTCTVRWLIVGPSGRPTELIDSEEVSVYDIRAHDDYKFRPDDVIIRIVTDEDSINSSRVGVVEGLAIGGRIPVVWADSTRSLVIPENICLVNSSDDLSQMSNEVNSTRDNDETSSSISDSSASWETEEETLVEEFVAVQNSQASLEVEEFQESSLLKDYNSHLRMISLIYQLWYNTLGAAREHITTEISEMIDRFKDIQTFGNRSELDVNLADACNLYCYIWQLLKKLESIITAKLGAEREEVLQLFNDNKAFISNLCHCLENFPHVDPKSGLLSVALEMAQICCRVENKVLLECQRTTELDQTLCTLIQKMSSVYRCKTATEEVSTTTGKGCSADLLGKMISGELTERKESTSDLVNKAILLIKAAAKDVRKVIIFLLVLFNKLFDKFFSLKMFDKLYIVPEPAFPYTMSYSIRVVMYFFIKDDEELYMEMLLFENNYIEDNATDLLVSKYEITSAWQLLAENITAPQSFAENTTAPQSLAENASAPQSLAESTTSPQSLAENITAPQSLTESTTAPQSLSENTVAPQSLADTIGIKFSSLISAASTVSSPCLLNPKFSDEFSDIKFPFFPRFNPRVPKSSSVFPYEPLAKAITNYNYSPVNELIMHLEMYIKSLPNSLKYLESYFSSSEAHTSDGLDISSNSTVIPVQSDADKSSSPPPQNNMTTFLASMGAGYICPNLLLEKLTDKSYDKSVDSGDMSFVNSNVVHDASKSVIYGSCKSDNASEQQAFCLQESLTGLTIVPCAPRSHKFFSGHHQPTNASKFLSAIRKEGNDLSKLLEKHYYTVIASIGGFAKALSLLKMLTDNLPHGIHVKAFEDRMDLYSCMILGPAKTPYEDLPFIFDMKLPDDYPLSPPQVFYHPFCSDRLNPNLYEDGKVCLSLLGTWSGKDTEMWTTQSNLLQVLLSIQGLILVPEPYYNEAGFESQKGSQYAQENSRMYNEMALLKITEAMGNMMQRPPEVYRDEILQFFKNGALQRFISRLCAWLRVQNPSSCCEDKVASICDCNQPSSSILDNGSQCKESVGAVREIMETVKESVGVGAVILPSFPLFPMSRGFLLALNKKLDYLKQLIMPSDVVL